MELVFNLIRSICLNYCIVTPVHVCSKYLVSPTTGIYDDIHILIANWTGSCALCNNWHGGQCDSYKVSTIICEYLPPNQQCDECGQASTGWEKCNTCGRINCWQCLDSAYITIPTENFCIQCAEYEQEAMESSPSVKCCFRCQEYNCNCWVNL